ncbi:TonB-dependent receptor plug domain-containing protein [Phycisphaerales bacterium AB-hyl4]|uniref:TonB-dependent receptor plug domain-containing protein n=1 Tax=Natronomicrosphaera hydrolytica TaxID=3242702 RepID=A0ABV4U053_9BACT
MLFVVFAAHVVADTADEFDDFDDDITFAGLSLEELMSIRVTSVAGKEMDWFTTPSAMYVLTAEEIRRSGHQSLPEALRMVPGLTVSQTSSNSWAVSARGFHSRYANHLLVMIDGRTVYDPYFSGVLWHKQHVLLEDIDRIEIVRGPGATLWGANAVNGVINVTTRPASETQGLYLSGVTGSRYNSIVSSRYGGEIDDDTHYRVWSSYRNVEPFREAEGGDFPDAWDMTHGGFRLDRQGDEGVLFTLQADAHGSNRINQRTQVADPDGLPFALATITGPGRTTGSSLLGRISQDIDPHHGWSLQAYYNYNDDVANTGFRNQHHTTDLDFRHHFRPLDRHEVVWGLGYRYVTDNIRSTDTMIVDPTRRDIHTASAFIQDTVTLVPDWLSVMVGSKFEHNSYTGFEYQPSLRIALTPTERQTVWASVSRAVQVPSRYNTDTTTVVGYFPFPPPNDRMLFRSNPDLESVSMVAYEAGYRVKLTDQVAIDTAVFLNRYRNMITVDWESFQWANGGTATTYGVETTTTWRPAANWRLDFGYTYLRARSEDPFAISPSPRHQGHLRSFLDVTDDVELNTALYWTDRIDDLDIASYLRWDLGVTWHVTQNFEFSVWGQNLLQSRHTEFVEPFLQGGEAQVPRSFYMQATMRF